VNTVPLVSVGPSHIVKLVGETIERLLAVGAEFVLDNRKLFLDLVDHRLKLENLGTGYGDQFAVFFN
jgi:hypothetical protein